MTIDDAVADIDRQCAEKLLERRDRMFEQMITDGVCIESATDLLHEQERIDATWRDQQKPIWREMVMNAHGPR